MMSDFSADYSEPIDTILVKVREFDETTHPDLHGYQSVILRNGPRAYKIAKFWSIRNRHTGEIHHHYLTLQTLTRSKKDGWKSSEQRKISLSDEDDSKEIIALIDFLNSVSEVKGSGDYLVLNAGDVDTRLSQILQFFSSSDQNISLLSEVLLWASSDETVLRRLMTVAANEVQRSRALIAALNYTRYSDALAKFRAMIDRDPPEREFQAFLEENYWMFGSEYSELIEKRALAGGIQVDFPLRRTVDDYLDIIEIKRPFNEKPLFLYDESHKNYFQGNDLSKAIAQVMKYIETLRAEKYRIAHQDNLLTGVSNRVSQRTG